MGILWDLFERGLRKAEEKQKKRREKSPFTIIRCYYCGSDNDISAKNCYNCGNKL
jgi:hypothetical protein